MPPDSPGTPKSERMKLTLKTVPAAQGLQWVRQGVREFFRHPLGYSALFVAFMLAGTVLSLLPGFGEVLVLAGIPLLTLAYMMATAASQRGVRPQLGVFFAPWRHLPSERRRSLLTLSLGYAFGTLLLLMACGLIDHGGVEQLMQALTANNPDPDEVARLADTPGVMAGVLARVSVTLLLSLPFWHAPALVCWAGQRPAQAMFSSVLALWHTRAAMLVYGLAWMGLMMATGLVLSLLVGLLGGSSLLGLLTMPLALVLTSAYYVSLFFTFRGSFGQPEEPEEAPIPPSP